MRLFRRRPRTLPDLITENMRRPDPVPAPPVDLLLILMAAMW